MNNFPNVVLWVYIILLLVGGLIGFLKAGSKVSLISSVVFAGLLILTTLPKVFQPGFASGMVNVLMTALLIIFAIRLTKSKKFIPSGLMLIITIVALALRNLFG